MFSQGQTKVTPEKNVNRTFFLERLTCLQTKHTIKGEKESLYIYIYPNII